MQDLLIVLLLNVWCLICDASSVKCDVWYVALCVNTIGRCLIWHLSSNLRKPRPSTALRQEISSVVGITIIQPVLLLLPSVTTSSLLQAFREWQARFQAISLVDEFIEVSTTTHFLVLMIWINSGMLMQERQKHDKCWRNLNVLYSQIKEADRLLEILRVWHNWANGRYPLWVSKCFKNPFDCRSDTDGL